MCVFVLFIPFAKKCIRRLLNRNNQQSYEGVNTLDSTNINIELTNTQQIQQIEQQKEVSNTTNIINNTKLEKNKIDLNDSLSTSNESKIDILTTDSTDLSKKDSCNFHSKITIDDTKIELEKIQPKV